MPSVTGRRAGGAICGSLDRLDFLLRLLASRTDLAVGVTLVKMVRKAERNGHVRTQLLLQLSSMLLLLGSAVKKPRNGALGQFEIDPRPGMGSIRSAMSRCAPFRVIPHFQGEKGPCRGGRTNS